MTTAPAAAPASLFAKLAQIMGEVGQIEARGKNDFLGTRYITEDDVVDAVRDKLAARKIAVMPGLGPVTREPAKTPKGKETALTTARISFTFCDGETGETYTCEWAGVGEDALDKGLTKAETSALRTFLLKAFFVSAGPGPGDVTAAPPRADGQAPMTQEQYDGINAAYTAAGQPEADLHAELDRRNVIREYDGRALSVGERVTRLGALDAVAIHKFLAAKEVKA